MADTVKQSAPGPSRWLSTTYLAAGIAGLVCAGMAGRLMADSSPPAHPTLSQARAEFDAGQLPAAALGFRTLASAGDPQGEYWYGYALDRGLGVVSDPTAAIAQYQKALAGGVTPAATRLGELYLDGNAITPDFAKARSYLTEAATRGDPAAATDLGHMLRDGIGGPADPVKAYAWLEVAALRGDGEARAERDQLLPSLAPSQQEEATQQAAALQVSAAPDRTGQSAKPAAPAAKS